ncbi:MAG: tyrosine-type recombinase/integrase [Planctomycetes bacterium]|nr:tyrosine-type recombinase/integrase [Planctomycetota bacterium]
MNPTTMSAKVAEYLTFRRDLGYQLRIEGLLLRQFARHADDTGHRGPLTTELALQWARLPSGADRLYQARRLEIVRCFARYLAATEPGTEIPGRGLLGPAHRRTSPRIFTKDEVAGLMIAAGRLGSPKGLRPHTYRTLIGLLAACGLRISEALHLENRDTDLVRGMLTIRETKFRKTRLVPLHPTAIEPLRAYVVERNRIVTNSQCERFFVNDRGLGLPYSTVRTVFRKLCNALTMKATGRRPRLHDLRHTFACRRVEQWYDTGVDVAHAIAALSVYLGHAKVTDTYWYLTATPDLMARAATRFEAFVQPTEKEVRP